MPKTVLKSQPLLYLAQASLLAAVYFGGGKLGLSLASVEGIVTLVWPPTGIALAGLLLGGYRLWPGVFLGAFLVNILTDAPLAAVMGISVGNTLEAVTGAYLLRRLVGFRNSLERLRDVLGLVFLAAALSTIVSATSGVASLGLTGVIPWAAAASTWWVWWLGDAMGALVVAPALLTWGHELRPAWPSRRLLEAALLLAALILVSQTIFSGWLAPHVVNDPLAYTLFPFLIWAALRFGQRGAVTATLIGTSMAVGGTAQGLGPFAQQTVHLNLLLLSGFMSTAAVTAMLLAAVVAERRRAEEALRASEERFRRLSKAAFEGIIIHDGHKILDANEAFATMTGYDLSELIGINPLTPLAPESRELVLKNIQAGYEQPYEVWGLRKDGSIFPTEVHAKKMSYHGQPVRVVAVRDITERKQAEEALRVSEERFRQVILSISDHIYVTEITAEGRFVNHYLSPHAETLTGYPQKKFMADWDFWPSVIHPDDRTAAAAQAARLVEGQNSEVEYRLVRADGDIIWVRDSARVRSEGAAKLIYGVVSDITTRKQAEEELRRYKEYLEELVKERTVELEEANEQLQQEIAEHQQTEVALRSSEERFSKAFRASPVAITITTLAEGRFLDVNDHFLDLMGYRREEVIGHTSIELEVWPHPDVRRRVAQALGEQQLIRSMEIPFRAKAGKIVETLASMELIDLSGERCILSLTQDITERKRAEARQAQLLRELESANRELNDFAYVVSHDLKAPLRAIGSLADWLAADYADKLDEEGRQQLSLLVGRVKRMHALIDGTLQYSRLGRSREDRVEVNLNNLLSEVIELIAPPPHIEIKLEHPLPTVIGEKTRLQQLFQNLLSNAVKFMDKPHGEISIGCTEQDGFWQFHVADNGPGIEAKHFARIFQLFQTLTPRDEFENTGVGLALVKKIVELHGGKVWVESKVGEGSTFFFTLPK